MIINFDQTPDGFLRLSESALEKGELVKALRYCEKALEGKRAARLLLADIYLRMGRTKDAMDAALFALAQGTDQKAEAFDIMAKATTAAGKLYDSIFYVMGKAQIEGDEDTLDAMDEVMDDLVGSFSEPKPKPKLFLVGKERMINYAREMDRAMFLFTSDQYDKAKEIALSVPESDELFEDAQDMILRCEVRLGDKTAAAQTAKSILERDPKNGFALYVLISVCREKGYESYIENVGDDPSDIYYAITAAQEAKDREKMLALADKLLRIEPFAPETYFVAAGAYLNARKKNKSIEILKTLFSIYNRYPASMILDDWAFYSRSDLMFGGTMPETVIGILEKNVGKHVKNAKTFIDRWLSDREFRAAVRLLFEENQTESVEKILKFLGEIETPKVRKAFEEMLISTRIDQDLKCRILSKLLLTKHKGKLSLVPSAVIVGVSCRKPLHYELYSDALKIAYADVLSFLTCMFDHRSVKDVSALSEKVFERALASEKESAAVLGAAIACVILSTSELPFVQNEGMAEAVVGNYFELGRTNFARMKRLVSKLR